MNLSTIGMKLEPMPNRYFLRGWWWVQDDGTARGESGGRAETMARRSNDSVEYIAKIDFLAITWN